MKDESVINLLRNHPANNIPLLIQLITDYIQTHYAGIATPSKKTIQQAIDITISQLRCYQQPYEYKKYIIFSDFTNFGYSGFQTFDLWDTQGYTFSLNGVYIGSWKLNGYETFKYIADHQVIQDYMQNMNGELYDVNLFNANGQKINLNQFHFDKQVDFVMSGTRTSIGEYETKYPADLLQMRIKEGFKVDSPQTVSIRVNFQIKLIYQVQNQNVQIFYDRVSPVERILNHQKKISDVDNEMSVNLRRLFETYKQRDYLQEIVLEMRAKNISIDAAMTQLVKSKAFENQKFVNRNFKQISLVFLIRAINFRQYQEEGEEFNKTQFYFYIRQKVQEVATKSIQNCLLYQQGQDFMIIRIIWHSHTILRLICIYENEEMLPVVQSRIQEVFKSNQILRNSLIQFDHSFKNLLINSETHQLKKNPDISMMESTWEWPKTLIWDMQQMYRILTSLRVKSNYLRVPSEDDRSNKFFVAQLDLEKQKTVVVQNLVLKDDKIICNVFAEQLINNVRQILFDYFQKLQDHERQIVISLHTVHSMYRWSLIKKQNDSKRKGPDFFTLQFVTRQGKQYQQRDKIIEAFIQYADIQARQYPDSTSNLNYDCLLTKAYNYQEIKQKYIENSRAKLNQGYQQVLQTIADHSVMRKQSNTDKDLFFLAIAPQRLLMIVFTDENTTFYLICLEQIERNHNSHLFLNEMQEKKIDQLIGYVLQEYNSAFAKEVHQLYLNNMPNPYLAQAIQGCQVQIIDFDLYEVCSLIKLVMEQPQRKLLKKSFLAEESPGKQQRKGLLATPNQVKLDFLKDCCKIWDDRLEKIMFENKVSMKMIPKTQDQCLQLYYYDKQQMDKQDKFEKVINILFMSQSFKEGDQEFENMIQLLDYSRFKQKKSKIILSFSVYYYEARSLSKILNNDCDCPALIIYEEPTSVTTKILRWTEYFYRYNSQFMFKFQSEMHRLLSVNKENIDQIVSLIESIDNKVIELNQQDKKFDQFFSIQFFEEMKNTEIQNSLFRFLAISEEYYAFIMNQDNIDHFNQNDFKTEREYLKEEPYVIPFWVIVQVRVYEERNEGQVRMITYTEQSQDATGKIINELKKLIEDTIATTNLYLIIKKVSESSHRERIKLVLKPKYDLEADQKASLEQGNDGPGQRENVNKLPVQNLFEQRKLRKLNTQIINKVQERKEYLIPHVELRVFHTYQSKLQHLINNTILMNQQIEDNQYCWYLDKQVYLFMFQTSKNILNYGDKYPELREGAMPGCLSIIMNVYSTSKNKAKIKQDIDQISEHIQQKIDEETINALAQGILRNPRLKEQEYNQIQQGEHSQIEILINHEIQDMLAFSVFMRHNLEKTFLKYEVQMQEKRKPDIQKDDTKFIVDQHENSFIFSKYKVVHSPNVHLQSFFGQGLCLLNFLYQVDGATVVSYVFPKQPRQVQQQDVLKILPCLPIIQMKSGKYISKSEISYDITTNYQEKFLIIDITHRGEIKWDSFKQYFQVLVRQVELEYSLECLLQKNYKLSDVEYIFRQLNEYSFKLHHFVYPLHYEEVLWKSTKNWIRAKILAEIEKKGILQTTLQQFETQQIMDGPILGYRPLIYYIQDNPDSDTIDSIKHCATQKLKKNDHDPADLYHRSLLLYIKVSNTLEVFLYNVNWDMAASINHQLGILSRWSIIRNLVAQKIKNDLCACYNIRLSPLFEEIFLAKHNIYQHSIVNDLHRLRSQEQPVSKQKVAQRKEGQQDQFPTVSKAIECLVTNEFPPIEYQLFEFVKHLDQFFKLNLCMVKPKKLAINSTEGDGDFLQREGKAYLELLKEFYKNVIQMQLILYVKKLQLKNLSQIPQSKAILDKVLNQSTCIYTNVFPLFLFRQKEKPGLKGSLDLEKEYYALINEVYQRMIKQKDFDLFFGDDVIMEEQFNDEDMMKKNTIIMSEEDFKSLIQPIDIHVYFSEAMIKEVNMQVQNTDVYKRVNYLRYRNNPSLVKVVTLITFKYLFIFEKLYCLPGTEVPKTIKEDSPFEEIEKYHSELIDQNWKNQKLLNMYLLFYGYCKMYEKYNKSYPKCESISYKINVGFVLDWIKLEDFKKFIRINSQIYYLHKVHDFYTYEAPNLISKAEQLSIQLFLGLLGQNEKLESQKVIELELDEQQQGSQQLNIIVYLLVNNQHGNQFLGAFENSIIETLKRAHKNFMAYSWWSKIKTNQYISGQDLGFLIQYCQQIQTKKLAKEIKFEQLDDKYRQKQFPIDQFISRIHFSWCLVGNKKALIIINDTQDVLYIVDLQDNMIENIRILYMIIDNPQYDQEKMIKPHFDECTQLIKKFIDEMI